MRIKSTTTNTFNNFLNVGSDHLPVTWDNKGIKIASFNCLSTNFLHYLNNNHVLQALTKDKNRIENVVSTILKLISNGYLVCLQELSKDIISYFKIRKSSNMNLTYSYYKNDCASYAGYAYDSTQYKIVDLFSKVEDEFLKTKHCYGLRWTLTANEKVRFYTFNVHMPVKLEGSRKHEYSNGQQKMAMLVKKIYNNYDTRIIVMGDFNETSNELLTKINGMKYSFVKKNIVSNSHCNQYGILKSYDHIYANF